MASAAGTALWAAVVARYDEDGLVGLTNPRDSDADAINTARGELAADDVITTWWPIFVQHVYQSDPTLVDRDEQVAVVGVIALLWKQGGSASSIQRVEWEDWVTLAEAYRDTVARGAMEPKSTSQVTESDENPGGGVLRPWSDRSAFRGLTPRRNGHRENPFFGFD